MVSVWWERRDWMNSKVIVGDYHMKDGGRCWAQLRPSTLLIHHSLLSTTQCARTPTPTQVAQHNSLIIMLCSLDTKNPITCHHQVYYPLHKIVSYHGHVMIIWIIWTSHSLAHHGLPVVAADVVEPRPVVVEPDVEGRDTLLPVPSVRLGAVNTIHWPAINCVDQDCFSFSFQF